MRVLITGGNGLIGREVCAALASLPGVDVFAPPSSKFDILHEDARWNAALAQGADCLIHCAWVTEHGAFWNSPQNEQWLQMSKRLFERFVESGGQRIIGLGSCAEYDWTDISGPLREEAAIAPHTAYGKAKALLSNYLQNLATRSAVSYVWGRVFFTFGPGEPAGKLLPTLMAAQMAGQDFNCGPAESLRDFCSFRQLGGMLAGLAMQDKISGAVNLASGGGISLHDIAKMAGNAAGTDQLSARHGPGRPGEPNTIIADTQRLKEFGLAVSAEQVRTEMQTYLQQIART